MSGLVSNKPRYLTAGLALAMLAVAGCSTASTPAKAPASVQPSNQTSGAQSAAPDSGPPKPVNLTMATPPSASGYYAYMVGVGKAVQTAYPHIKITAQETGGAGDQHKLLFKRDADFATITSTFTDQQLKGYGAYQDNKDDQLRVLWWYSPLASNWAVRDNSGITSLEQLSGKKFNPGGTGTTAQKDTEVIFGLFGIKPDYYHASQADASTAFQDGRIIGVTKGGQPPDSYVVELGATQKIRLLGLTDAQVKQITDKWPYYSAYTIPANSYKGQDAPIKTISVLTGVGTSTKLSEEVAYQIVKGMWANKEQWQTSFPPSKDINVPALTMGAPYPLHAGAVRAWKELGINVPQALIPPEYKG